MYRFPQLQNFLPPFIFIHAKQSTDHITVSYILLYCHCTASANHPSLTSPFQFGTEEMLWPSCISIIAVITVQRVKQRQEEDTLFWRVTFLSLLLPLYYASSSCFHHHIIPFLQMSKVNDDSLPQFFFQPPSIRMGSLLYRAYWFVLLLFSKFLIPFAFLKYLLYR